VILDTRLSTSGSGGATSAETEQSGHAQVQRWKKGGAKDGAPERPRCETIQNEVS